MIILGNLNPLKSQKFLAENISYSRASHDQRLSYNDSEYQNRFYEYMGNLLTDIVTGKRPSTAKSGYLLDDLLIQCTFNGRLCHRNLTPFFHPNYGNCFTFDNDLHVETERQSEASHSWTMDDDNTEDGYKLFLELFLHQNEYIPYLDDRAAFRVFIHRKHEIPILSQNSLFLAPTTYTKLIFSQRIISFSQQCRNDLTDDMKQTFGSNSVRYSQALCFKLCEFRSIQTFCNCTDWLFLVFFQFFNQNQTTQTYPKKLCPINNTCLATHNHSSKYFEERKIKLLLLNYFLLLDTIKNCAECLPECELVQYTVQSSYADYPNSRSTDKVLQRIEKYFNNIGNKMTFPNTSTCYNSRRAILLDDIVAVGISASPYATEILSESPMYTWVDLISSIGGQTGKLIFYMNYFFHNIIFFPYSGLWIGVSLISFVEIAELLFLLLIHFIKILCECILQQWKHFHQRFF